MSSTETEALKLSQGRSPAYPYIPLAKALERINQVYDARVGQNAYPPGTFYKIWDLGAKSSGARQTMAALNHFGLVDYVGRGEDRKVQLSSLAIGIAQDKRPNSPDRLQLLQKAALSPPIHRKLYEKFPPPMPDDVFVEHFLISDCDYNESAASALIREYKATLDFSGLNEPGALPIENREEASSLNEDEAKSLPRAELGNLVNWESGGVLQWREPWRIVSIDKHEDGSLYYKVEGLGEYLGDSGWIPADEAVIHDPSSKPREKESFAPPTGSGHTPPPSKGGMRKAVFPVFDGDVTLIFPENISPLGLDELGAYLDIFLKKEKRAADPD